ncbi:hypothetical protein BV898_19148 [Hypsibius exemplaris]|uniref:Uncharacterized protein n=1 Tax=Hypsibius exemplaris TaxID=2072580 RepID=A0A9X6NK86_HYPEX|nr:hypothetical protein BV898_19148 [Hypsibius exemplaris]
MCPTKSDRNLPRTVQCSRPPVIGPIGPRTQRALMGVVAAQIYVPNINRLPTPTSCQPHRAYGTISSYHLLKHLAPSATVPQTIGSGLKRPPYIKQSTRVQRLGNLEQSRRRLGKPSHGES